MNISKLNYKILCYILSKKKKEKKKRENIHIQDVNESLKALST